MRRNLPDGSVTLVFTDIEGSSKLLHELGAESYADALAEHRRLLREVFAGHGGTEIDTQGDAFFYVFPDAREAIAAAEESREALRSGPIHVRVGIHTGTPHLGPEGYVGEDVHLGARIGAAGHGGQVLLSDDTRRTAALEEGVQDLGEHRVKDFDRPVLIFQLGAERFPPLKTISNTNLPRPTSSFIGRGKEVGEVVALIRDGARLVTLTGPGGSGKTRLAIESAIELVGDQKAGTFWVGLAAIRDPARVTDEIAKTLGAQDGLADHIGEREMLLLLDNLEQVIEAAPALATLVETCKNLRLLVTSRELLRIRGELEYPVTPLADTEAVQLFCVRARAEPDESVRQLCRALDNLPLALELAAARSSVLSPRQILDRLSGRLDELKAGRDADIRQRTLRAAIAWSYDLLSLQEQQLFARMAVFVGGCTLEAAGEVAEADLDTLQSLVDKSLLRHANERFGMLETIHEFALEQLETRDEAADLRRRHAAYFLHLAEEAEPHLSRAGSSEWLDRLEIDHYNVRAALDRLEATGETRQAMLLVVAMKDFWELRGHLAYAGGRRRLEALLAADVDPTPARAKGLNAAALMAYGTGDLATMKVRAEEALELYRTLGDAWGVADSFLSLGVAAVNEGDAARAQPLLEDSARGFRELGDDHYALEATRFLAWAYEDLGDRDRARALYEDDLGRARALGNERIEALALGQLAVMALEDGRRQDALSMLHEEYRIHRELGDLFRVAVTLGRLAKALSARRETVEAAAQILSASDTLLEEVGVLPPWVVTLVDEVRGSVRRELDANAFADAWERGQALTPDDAVALALRSGSDA